jgi:hypothetical protein
MNTPYPSPAVRLEDRRARGLGRTSRCAMNVALVSVQLELPQSLLGPQLLTGFLSPFLSPRGRLIRPVRISLRQ